MFGSDRYSPKEVEKRLYEKWQKSGLFETSSDEEQSFSIVLPPPNVTGSLHLGHALNHTIQDCLIRWKRMQKYHTVWFPGTDHAGIATQIQVEKKLAQENLTRDQIGRKKFVEKVWEWKNQYGNEILGQMKRLGDSCNWDRLLFTLDPSSVRAVRKTFVHFYKKGKIYKGTRLVNWSTGISSAISDLEVEYRKVKSRLYEIKYFCKDQKDFLVISTTRPETIFADQAIAVHPEDSRYQKYHGKFVTIPLTNKEIPIITDSYVDPEFGTGVLKVTPAHDFNDYKIGKAHKLKELNLLSKDGKLNENAGAYQGLSVQKAREQIVLDLKEKKFLLKEQPHKHQVGFCSRSGSVVEPFLSDQWFLKMDDLAQKALQVVEKGEIEFIPYKWVKTYQHWMKNIDDWCISRQLWWGHQIPAWFCLDCSKVTVQEEDCEVCEHCSSRRLKQDEDVLDTWFSSALWPMSVLRWPDEDISKNSLYPSSVIVTGPDILFFWISRMIMMGLEFQNQVPFKKVYLHGVVRDSQGRKMSKSLGNGEDPIDLIEEYGADALRLYLLYSHAMGRDIVLSKDTLKVCRNFMNKIWNASRFIHQITKNESLSSENISPMDQWILYKLKETEVQIHKDLNEFQFSSACLKAYNFAWMEFCDWYLEWIKPIVYGSNKKEKQGACFILNHVLNHLLRLLHPFIPFITEEIYQNFFNEEKSILLSKFPSGDDDIFSHVTEKSYKQIEFVKDVITVIRQIRGENNIKPSSKIDVFVWVPKELSHLKIEVQNQMEFILNLTQSRNLTLVDSLNEKELSATMPLTSQPKIKVSVPLKGLIDVESELKRLEKKIQKSEKECDQLQQQLQIKDFVLNAPVQVVEEKKLKLQEVKVLLNHLKKSKNKLESYKLK